MAWQIAGKTVVITGATSGIGLEAAVALARMDASVVLVGRDAVRLAAAVDRLERAGARAARSYLCDLSSQSLIRRLAAELLRDLPRIDVLVNNAGGVHRKRQVTADGIEKTFATNHLGYFLLTTLLLDRIKVSAPARIVTVASIGHRGGTMDLEDPGFERGGYSIMRAYARSKLANVLFANELARRLDGTGVTSNSLHPGAVDTNLWSGAPLWAKPIIYLFLRRGFISAEQGARSIVQLAGSPELEGVSGQYFEELEPVQPAPLAQDSGLGRKLWTVSEHLTGVLSCA